MYLDTAILVKLVVREPDSLFYAGLVDGQIGLCSSQILLTEVWSALCRKERERAIDAETRRQAWTRCERYVQGGALLLEPVTGTVLRRANAIIERCHPAVPVRTLDAIHLASAEIGASWPILSNDRCVRAAAQCLRLPLGPLPTQD